VEPFSPRLLHLSYSSGSHDAFIADLLSNGFAFLARSIALDLGMLRGNVLALFPTKKSETYNDDEPVQVV
jgi:hypothetical protein